MCICHNKCGMLPDWESVCMCVCIVVVEPRTAWSNGICAGYKKHVNTGTKDDPLNNFDHCHHNGHSVWRIDHTGLAVAQNQVG